MQCCPAAVRAERHVGGDEVRVELRVGLPAGPMTEGGRHETGRSEVSGPCLAAPDSARRVLQVGQGGEHRSIVSGDDVLGARSITESPKERHGFGSREAEIEPGVLPVPDDRLTGPRIESFEGRSQVLRRHLAVKPEQRAPRTEPPARRLALRDAVVIAVVGDDLEVVVRRVGVGGEPRNAEHTLLSRRGGQISHHFLEEVPPGRDRDSRPGPGSASRSKSPPTGTRHPHRPVHLCGPSIGRPGPRIASQGPGTAGEPGDVVDVDVTGAAVVVGDAVVGVVGGRLTWTTGLAGLRGTANCQTPHAISPLTTRAVTPRVNHALA